MDPRPNILLVMTDTSRCDTLACYGNPHAVSPNLDRLAAEGVLFEQAHTAAPVCMPARTSLLTGVHTPVHGCVENAIAPRSGLTTVPDALAEAGYATIMVGKTHFGAVPESFHVQRVLAGEKNGRVDDFYADHLRAHGYERATGHPNPVPEELFSEAFLVDTTIAEIDRVRAEPATARAPFFAFCSLLSPHSPLDPPGRWANLFDDRPLPPRNHRPGEENDLPPHLRRLVGVPGDDGLPVDDPEHIPDDDTIDAQRRLYYGLAAYCDDQIGRLIHYLDDTGLRRNTLVIFTTDHGQQYYDHGFNDKHTFYDASWRIPLILSMPGTLPESERRDFAMTTDVTATILAAAGQDVPSVQGFDLAGPLADGAQPHRRCAVSVLYTSLALATQHWKLEYYPQEGDGRLFDRVADPLEQDDRFHDPAHRDVRAALTEALLAWRAELTDVQYLHQRTSAKGGPVAQRARAITERMRGSDAEARLDERAAAIDAAFAPAG